MLINKVKNDNFLVKIDVLNYIAVKDFYIENNKVYNSNNDCLTILNKSGFTVITKDKATTDVKSESIEANKAKVIAKVKIVLNFKISNEIGKTN